MSNSLRIQRNTSDNSRYMDKLKATNFEQAGESKQHGLVGEFASFLKQNKKYWMIPLLLALGGLATLILLGGTAIAPFIYTLF